MTAVAIMPKATNVTVFVADKTTASASERLLNYRIATGTISWFRASCFRKPNRRKGDPHDEDISRWPADKS